MTGLEFEGAEDLTEVQLNLLKKVLKDNGYSNNKVKIQIFGDPGDNFSGNVKRVVVEKENGEEFKMIMKTAFSNPHIMKLRGYIESVYKNEDIIYNRLFSKFEEYQENAGIPVVEKFKHAECYGATVKQFNEIILLEDLKEQGYIMLDRLTPLTDAQVKSILKNLAKLHALSFLLKHKEPNLFKEFENTLTNLRGFNKETKEHARFFKQVESNVLMVLESEDHKNIVKNIMSMSYDMSLEEKKVSKHCVILQGDAWINNFMFKLNSGTIPDSIMIDYQHSRSANPVCDLLYMIVNCTDYQTRKVHYLDWINYYHDELKDFLAKFELDVDFIYPKDQLDSDLKRYGNAGLLVAMCTSWFTARNREDAAKLKEAITRHDIDKMRKNVDIGEATNETIVKFKVRIEGVINSLIEFGLVTV